MVYQDYITLFYYFLDVYELYYFVLILLFIFVFAFILIGSIYNIIFYCNYYKSLVSPPWTFIV